MLITITHWTAAALVITGDAADDADGAQSGFEPRGRESCLEHLYFRPICYLASDLDARHDFFEYTH